MELPITSLVAGLAAIALVALSLPVSLRRIKIRTTLGDAGDEVLRRRIRAQGNFVEYVPLALLVLGLNELAGAAPGLLWAIAGTLVVGRLVHAIGFLRGIIPLLPVGMVLTYSSLLIGGCALLLRAS